MRKPFRFSQLVAVIVLAFLGPIRLASAAPIPFDNGEPYGVVDFLLASDADSELFDGDNFLVASDFSFASGIDSFSGVRWWGADTFGAPSSSFTISLYEDSAGKPGSQIFTYFAGEVESSVSPFSFAGLFPLLKYEVEFDLVELESETTYWIAIQNDVPGTSSWGWAPSEETGNTYFSRNGGEWTLTRSELSFQLIGAAPVPLPSTLLLLSLVLGGVCRQRAKVASSCSAYSPSEWLSLRGRP